MATNCIFANPYTLTASASSAVSSMPASNVDKDQPSDAWRSTGLTTQYLEMDLGSAKAVDVIAAMFTNLTSAATMRIRGATSQANLTASPGYDSGTINPAWAGATQNVSRPHTFKYLTAAETYRWWRIDFTDAANPDGYFEVGRVIIADAFVPTRNYALGAARGFRDLSTRKDAAGGQLLFETKAKRPTLSFELPLLTTSEVEATILEYQRQMDGPMLVMLSPDADAALMGRMYYGLVELTPPVRIAHNVWSIRVTVEGLT